MSLTHSIQSLLPLLIPMAPITIICRQNIRKILILYSHDLHIQPHLVSFKQKQKRQNYSIHILYKKKTSDCQTLVVYSNVVCMKIE